MGNMFGGGGGQMGPSFSTTNTVSTVAPPAKVQELYDSILPRLGKTADTPWSNYSDDANGFVAQLNSNQQNGINGLAANINSADPWLQKGMGVAQNGTGYLNSAYDMANSAGNSTVANNDIAAYATPYYNTATDYTQQAATSNGGYNAANPYFNTANGFINQGGQATNQVGQSEINQYMSPYQQSVINSTMGLLGQQNEQAMQGALGNVIRNGGFGNDRAGVMMANQNQQNQLSNASVLAGLNNQNYAQALNAAVGQRAQNQADLQRQLAAGQAAGQIGSAAGQLRNADLTRQLAAGQQMTNIGTQQRQAYEQQQQFRQADLARQLASSQAMGQYGTGLANIGMQGAQIGMQNQVNNMNANNALIQAGTMQQQTEQAGKDAMYNQWLQQKAYPFMTGQWLADMYSGFGPLYGSQTSQNGSSISIPLGNVSDPRLKSGVGDRRAYRDGGSTDHPEVVGKTFDDQPIYRYSLMGGPAQLGLMADEVAQRDPKAVGNIGDIMTLDYARATDRAADIGHEMNANHRIHKDLGGALASQAQMYAMLKKRNAAGPGGDSFVPTRQGGGKGALQGSPMSMPAAQAWRREQKPVDIMGMMSNAKGLAGLGKGGGMGDFGKGALDTVAKAFTGPAEAATATASGAAPILEAGKSATNLADASDWFGSFFANRGGAVPHLAIGGEAPFADEMEGSIVPKSTMKKQSLPVAPPMQMEPAQGQKSGSGGGGGGIGSLLSTGTQAMGAIKGLGSLAGGASGAAAGAAGAAKGVASLLPFLAFLSDPKLKSGVGDRHAYATDGAVPMESDQEGRLVPVRSREVQAVDNRPVDVDVSRPKARADYNAGDFDANVGNTFKYEGGYTPDDAGHGPSNHGINAAAHPGLDIKNLSKEKAREIYQNEYWNGAGIDNLPANMRGYAFDTSVNMGPGRVKQFMDQSGGDPQKFHELRANFYQHLIDKNPEKFGRYASAWAGRMNAEASKMGLEPIALNYNGHSSVGRGGSGPEYDGGGDYPAGARNYMASAKGEEEGGLGGLLNVALPIGAAAMHYAANRRVSGGGPAAMGAIAGGLGMLGSMTDADIQRRRLEQQMEIERRRLEIQEGQEGRAARDFERQEQDRERDREDVKPGAMPTAPEGGYGPPEQKPEIVAPVNPAPKQEPPMSVTPGATEGGVGNLGGGNGGVSNIGGQPANPASTQPASESNSDAVTGGSASPEKVHEMQTGLPDPSKFWRNVVNEQNPFYLRSQADYWSQEAQKHLGNPRMQERGRAELAKSKEFMDQARQAPTARELTMKDGTTVPNPWFVKSETDIKRADQSVADENTLVPYVPYPGGPTQQITKKKALELANGKGNSGEGEGQGYVTQQGASAEEGVKTLRKKDDDLSEAAMKRQTEVLPRLDRMLEIMQNFETGKWAEQKANLVAGMRSVGIDVPSTATANPEKFFEFVKNSTNAVFDQAKMLSQDGGGRILVTEIEGLKQASVNANATPESNRQLLARARAVLKFQDYYYDKYNEWRDENPYATSDRKFQLDFNKTAKQKLDEIKEKELKRTTALGSENPPQKIGDIPVADKREVGKTYNTPKGPMTWMGSGWQPAGVK
jgi:hypothetical protein